jgi:5-methylcytosine-specific restriction endonuclease McrA
LSRQKKHAVPRSRPCKGCGLAFTSTGFRRWCSFRCRNGGIRIQTECYQCGKTFMRPSRRQRPKRGRTFCSRECMRVALAGRGSAMYRGGPVLYRGSQWRHLAERIRDRDHRQCRRCGKPEEENQGRRLHVDHIIPIRIFDSIEEANSEKNLASLCSSCHAHKTADAERRHLRGDNFSFSAYLRAIGL